MPKLTPLRYHGSKAGQVKRLRLALPEYFDYLIEPFCGSAAFSLSMIQEGFIEADKVWLNDKNPSLMAFWKTLQDNRYGLQAELRRTVEIHGLGNRVLFIEAYNELANPSGNIMDLAKARFIENYLGRAGKASNRSNYNCPIKSIYGLREKYIRPLNKFGALLEGSKLTCMDFREIVPHSKNSLSYLDGPYGNKMDWDSYGKEYTLERQSFAEICNKNQHKGLLLISYGDNQESIDLFSGWNIYRVPIVRPSSNTKRQTELIITNYEIPNAESLDDEWEQVSQLVEIPRLLANNLEIEDEEAA